MASVLHRWFGLGRIPSSSRAQLEAEGIVLLAEGLWGSISFRNFKAPGRRHGYKKSGFVGSVALSEKTLVGFGFSRQVVGVALDDPLLHRLQLTEGRPGVLCIAFDAADFQDNASGAVECRWRTDHARQFIDQIQTRVRNSAP